MIHFVHHIHAHSVLPIVDGPPEGYHGFVPHNHSVIRIDDYPEPRELAALFRRLDNADYEYRNWLVARGKKLLRRIVLYCLV